MEGRVLHMCTLGESQRSGMRGREQSSMTLGPMAIVKCAKSQRRRFLSTDAKISFDYQTGRCLAPIQNDVLVVNLVLPCKSWMDTRLSPLTDGTRSASQLPVLSPSALLPRGVVQVRTAMDAPLVISGTSQYVRWFPFYPAANVMPRRL